MKERREATKWQSLSSSGRVWKKNFINLLNNISVWPKTLLYYIGERCTK